jgi:endonuclease YncB( thermonuclease family)
MKPHHKPLIGALAMLGALSVGIVGWAEMPRSSGGKGEAASDLFSCARPTFHDGDGIRCNEQGRSMRLYAIDAPEMPGSCKPGRQCTPGDPYASRDHLAGLAAGRAVTCRQLDTDRYGRKVVQCFAGKLDLSCAMVRDGFAIERYGRLDC